MENYFGQIYQVFHMIGIFLAYIHHHCPAPHGGDHATQISLSLPPTLSCIQNVFHVSLLKPYHPNVSYILD